jgi:hypothetical protein
VFIEEDDRELARRAGADGFVTREPDHRSIIDALGQALGARSNPVATAAEHDYDALHAERLGRATGFRNVVAHAYEQLDMIRVHRAASEGPRDLLAFLGALSRIV